MAGTCELGAPKSRRTMLYRYLEPNIEVQVSICFEVCDDARQRVNMSNKETSIPAQQLPRQYCFEMTSKGVQDSLTRLLDEHVRTRMVHSITSATQGAG